MTFDHDPRALPLLFLTRDEIGLARVFAAVDLHLSVAKKLARTRKTRTIGSCCA